MASFCSKCGTQAGGRFCPACGATMGGTPAPPALPVGAPAPAAGSSSSTKVIAIVLGVLILFGAIGIGGLVYVGFRAKQKLAELKRDYGVTGETSGSLSSSPRVFPPSTGTGCPMLEGQEAAGILGVAVNRVEFAVDGPDGSEWCRYWVNAEERKRLAREEFVAGINAVSKGADKENKNATESAEKLVGGALGALIDASGDNKDADFAFSIQLWRTGGKSQWEKLETARSHVKGITGVDFGDPTRTQQPEGLGDRSLVLPVGHSIMVLKGDTFFLLGFQQFVPGREKTTALARVVAGRL